MVEALRDSVHDWAWRVKGYSGDKQLAGAWKNEQMSKADPAAPSKPEEAMLYVWMGENWGTNNLG